VRNFSKSIHTAHAFLAATTRCLFSRTASLSAGSAWRQLGSLAVRLSEIARSVWSERFFVAVASRPASTLSWFPSVNSWVPLSSSLSPSTELRSSATSGEHDRPSVLVRTILFLLRVYKLLISPYFRGSCRFLPSCADYASEAFRTHGFFVGLSLTLRRLARCHPLGNAGHDPVPPARIGH